MYSTPFRGVPKEPTSKFGKRLIAASQVLRSKKDWIHKLHQREILNKWRQEFVDQGLSEREFQYVVKEAEYYASLNQGKIQPSMIDGIWEAEKLIEEPLRQELINVVHELLENVPDEKRDYHPDSKDLVVDLVHPSLYCFVDGLSRRTDVDAIPPMSFLGYGEPLKGSDESFKESVKKNEVEEGGDDHSEESVKKNEVEGGGDDHSEEKGSDDDNEEKGSDNDNEEEGSDDDNEEKGSDDDNSEDKKAENRSNPYQWLPAEFKVNGSSQVSIESYINNLHPERHKKLYPIIERIFESFIPLFNKTLTDLLFPRPDRVDVKPYNGQPQYDEPESPADMELQSDSSDEDAARLKKKLAEMDIMPDFVMLETEPFSPPDHIPYFVDLAGKTVQVIVKLANIELTPEKPAYEGGVWHVEGTPAENIVASGIYYYVSENISESRLRFRRAIEEPSYEQCDNVGVAYYYNLRDGDLLNEPLGSILTQESKMICFPNIFQHQVAPFELVDKSKRGYRKILVFFLVDPSAPILSTRNVPPQQFDYFDEKLREIEPFKSWQPGVYLSMTRFLGWPMRLEEAKNHRRLLMKHRKYYVDEEELFERPFSLCEH